MTQHQSAATASSTAQSDVVRRMLQLHPYAGRRATSDALVRCIEACYDCAATCTMYADACLAEPMVADLRACIRLNQDCAYVCAATGDILARITAANQAITRAMLHACETACRECEAECRKHAQMHEHCRVCANECARCAEACRAAMM